ITLCRRATDFGTHRSANRRRRCLSRNPRRRQRGCSFARKSKTSSSRNGYRTSTEECIATRSPLAWRRCPARRTRAAIQTPRWSGSHRSEERRVGKERRTEGYTKNEQKQERITYKL